MENRRFLCVTQSHISHTNRGPWLRVYYVNQSSIFIFNNLTACMEILAFWNCLMNMMHWYFDYWIIFTLSLCAGRIISQIFFLSSIEESLSEHTHFTLDFRKWELCKFKDCASKKKKKEKESLKESLCNYFQIHTWYFFCHINWLFPAQKNDYNYSGQQVNRWRDKKRSLTLGIFPPFEEACLAQLSC